MKLRGFIFIFFIFLVLTVIFYNYNFYNSQLSAPKSEKAVKFNGFMQADTALSYNRPCAQGLDLCTWTPDLPLGAPGVSGCSLNYNTLWPINTDYTASCSFNGTNVPSAMFYFSIDDRVLNCTLNGHIVVNKTIYDACAVADPRIGFKQLISNYIVSGQNNLTCLVQDIGGTDHFDACLIGNNTKGCGNGIVEAGEQCEPPNSAICDGNCKYKNLTCVQAKNAGLVFGSVVGGKANVTNNSPFPYLVGLAVYKMFDSSIDNQLIYDYNITINPGQTVYLSVNTPNCTYQIDLFCGDVLLSLNGSRYGDRLLNSGSVVNQGFCQREFCGDNIVNLNETCELPGTNNNSFCNQSTLTCLGNKTGTRNSFGNCDSNCGCVNTPFVYKCVKNSCGAECSKNSDCNDGRSATIDTCNANCGCEHRCISDSDKDCICNDIDKCPNSKANESVNAEGCDDFQFCSQFNCGSGCDTADFIPVLNDCVQVNSTNSNHDCTTVLLEKEGKLQPNCFPTTCAG